MSIAKEFLLYLCRAKKWFSNGLFVAGFLAGLSVAYLNDWLFLGKNDHVDWLFSGFIVPVFFAIVLGIPLVIFDDYAREKFSSRLRGLDDVYRLIDSANEFVFVLFVPFLAVFLFLSGYIICFGLVSSIFVFNHLGVK